MIHTWNGVVAVFLPKPDAGAPYVNKAKQSSGSWLCQRSGSTILQANYDPVAQSFVLTLAVRGATNGTASGPILAQMELDLFSCSCAVKLVIEEHGGQPDGAASSTAVLLLGHSKCASASTGTGCSLRQQQKQASQPPAAMPAQTPDPNTVMAKGPCTHSMPPLRSLASAPVPQLQSQQLSQQAATTQPQSCPAMPGAQHDSGAQQGNGVTLPAPPAESTVRPVVAGASHMLLADLSEEEEHLRGLLERYVVEPGFMDFVDKLEAVWTRMEAAAAAMHPTAQPIQ